MTRFSAVSAPQNRVHLAEVEGIVAGLIGATTIAVSFLILDTLNGRPFHTPTVLGTALFRQGAGLDAPGDLKISLEMVLMYTWVHVLAFCGLGEWHPSFWI